MGTTISLFTVRRFVRASVPMLAASVIACGDASTEPTNAAAEVDAALAAELETVAQSARAAGDSERDVAFTYAAEAVRLGIQPSTLVVSNDGQDQRFDAFVNAVDHRRSTEADGVGRRTLIAWRRTEVGTHLIYIGSPAARAQVSPAGNDAAAWYSDARTQTRWTGVSGSVTIAELESGGACGIATRAKRPSASNCTKAVFEVRFDLRFEQGGTNRAAASSATLKGLSAASQRINGAKLSQ